MGRMSMALGTWTGYVRDMNDDTSARPSRSLVSRLRGNLDSGEIDDDTRDLGLRILTRAERAVEHLEAAAATFETVAKVHLSILRRMAPIVQDLGEMVRHNLDEARESRGLRPRGPRKAEVINVDSETD